MNIDRIRKEFPILTRTINGKALVYLDNAATSQKPRAVIDALTHYYETTNANVHRGLHTLAEEATEAYEACRAHIARFINAQDPSEIIFTRNTTEAINLVAYSWAEQHISAGDEIIVSELEHHSNLIPWQQLVTRKNAILKVISLKDDYTLDYTTYENLLSSRTKLVAISSMSNALGTIIDLSRIIPAARTQGAKVLVDGAQSICHLGANVQRDECDFFTFSAHKMLGPTGVGVLYAKKELLEKMPPFLYGGDMLKTASQYSAEWNALPWKFEAGTPNIADVIAFDKALTFLEEIGFEALHAHDQKLLAYAKERFSAYPQLTLHSPADPSKCAAILSFTIEGVHPHDIATIFNEDAVAIRSGQHCAEPLMTRLGIPATARMSFYLYNTVEEIDRAEKALQNVLKIFKL